MAQRFKKEDIAAAIAEDGPSVNTSTAAVVDGHMQPVGADKVSELRTGPLLTAQGLIDRLDSVDGSEEVKSRLQGLLEDFRQMPLTSGLDLIREAKALALKGEDGKSVAVKDRNPQQVTRAKRLSEAKTIFAALCLIFKHEVKHFAGLGWEGCRSISANALEQANLTTSGGTKRTAEEREATAEAKAEGAAYAAAKMSLPKDSTPEVIVSKAIEVREKMRTKTAEDGAADALISLGEIMAKAGPHIAVLSLAENFRQSLPEEARTADFWLKFSGVADMFTRWGESWKADKANSGETVRLAAAARAAA